VSFLISPSSSFVVSPECIASALSPKGETKHYEPPPRRPIMTCSGMTRDAFFSTVRGFLRPIYRSGSPPIKRAGRFEYGSP
jgi:hypothetical protein